MNNLSKIVDILNNDENTVILKIKDNKQIELLSIGCFDGNEDMIVISKYTKIHKGLRFRIVHKDGTSWTFDNEYIVSSNVKAVYRNIIQTVVFDFGIPVDDSTHYELLKQFTYIKKLEDDLNASHTFVISGFEKSDMVLRKEGAFMGHISYEEAMNYLEERYKILSNSHSVSNETWCDIYTIITDKKD